MSVSIRVYDVSCSYLEDERRKWRSNKIIRIVTCDLLKAHCRAKNILEDKAELKIHSIQDRGEVDFIETDLQFSNFDNCDLMGAIFEETDLRSANFKTSRNFSIDLETNKVEKAIFSKDNVVNLLEKYRIRVE